MISIYHFPHRIFVCLLLLLPFTLKASDLPVVDQIASQTVCNGSAINAISFTGTGTSYSWTNSNPSIGLAANGTGNIASFTAVNTGTTPVTATITVTPTLLVTELAYITNSGSNTVSVINTATNTVIDSILVGKAPAGVSISPNGSRMYVTNFNSDNVSVINTLTNTVVATIPVGSAPEGVSVSPDGNRVYVANAASNTVSVINTANNLVEAIIPVGDEPRGLPVSPDGSRVYVANQSSNTVSVINTSTNTVIATISVGLEPWGVSVSPDGSLVYVANNNSNSVSVINTSTNMIEATISVGSALEGISISPDGSRVYVSNPNSNSVSVINASTNMVTATIPVGKSPFGVSFSLDGSRVYVANKSSNTVSVINTSTNMVVATIPVGSGPVSFGNFVTSDTMKVTIKGTPQTFTITVNPTVKPSVSITTAATSICAGTSAFFIATPTNGGSNPAYQWKVNGVDVGTNNATYTADSLNNKDAVVCNMTGSENCSSPSTVADTVVMKVKTRSISTANISICQGDNYTFNGNTYSTAGTYTAHLTCDSTVILQLSIIQKKQTAIAEETCSNEPYQFGDKILTQTGVYTAHFVSVSGCDSVVTLTLTVKPSYRETRAINIVYGKADTIDGYIYDKAGTYAQSFTAADGCDSTITTVIAYVKTLCPEIVVPAFFSPNGDGQNDFLEIENIPCYTESTVDIYDRYGKRVAHYAGTDTGWDGNYLGHPEPSADYWYVITLPETADRVYGHFTLKR